MNIFLSIALFIALTVSPADNENGLIEKAKKLHESIVTIDTHVDTPLRLMRGFDISIKNNSGQVDFPRMKEGGMDGVFFAVFIGQGPLTDSAYAYEKEHALNIFTEIHESVSASEDQAELAYTADDILSIEKKGKRAVYIGIENGYPIGKDIDLINKFYELGARYITLSHSHDNQICGSSTDRETKNSGGLTEFGRRVVNRMNQLGIMVDISHVSDDTFNDVIDVSTGPVIASHSCARMLC
ncbi:MAG: dipeptidase, partial [Melioribacteraceae bacterium]|nr:dipeptidase [Melioribacteraceae bacterium]